MKNTSKFEYSTIEEVIEAAKHFVGEKCNHSFQTESEAFCSPDLVGDFLLLNHEQTPHETFSVMFLNSKNKLICHEVIFSGSISSAQVYPRTIAQKALSCNAAAVILAHHHPSGDTKPSQSDIRLTENLKEALKLIDVKVLDHFVIGGKTFFSMASHQLM
ncbi:JAB domain-containing protein [Marinicella rhabdoformis]|uniref:JAB domain-containing protein n=1 Tax=Marinicella rhabdoformis TaxID=2580566 RepID=UPI0012AEC30A|nr:JAB domain-containing protein [Marinicella rhabdoformis]